MDRRLFAAKDERDIKDIGADTAVFLWNCFQRELHGVWVSSKQGNLEPHAFGGKFRCQVACDATISVVGNCMCFMQHTWVVYQTTSLMRCFCHLLSKPAPACQKMGTPLLTCIARLTVHCGGADTIIRLADYVGNVHICLMQFNKIATLNINSSKSKQKTLPSQC